MKKNILVILCDALRYDHVSSDLTPNLLRIASESLHYENCLAGNTTTGGSMPPLLCGQPKYLPEISVMARLRKKGYKSILLSTNPLVDQRFSKGWDRAVKFHPSEATDRNFSLRQRMRHSSPSFLLRLLKPIYRTFSNPSDYLVYSRADQMLTRARSIIDLSTSPFFLWIHLMDPHHPYFPRRALEFKDARELIYLNDKLLDAMTGKYKPEPEDEHIWSQLYKMEVAEMDEAIGQFFESLKWNDKILIITSDHGDEHGEHGQWGHRGNKFVPELQHVPLIVLGDRKGIVDQKFSHYDFPDLVLELVT